MRRAFKALFLLLIVGLLTLPGRGYAASAQEAFDAGNVAYGKGNYRTALKEYSRLLEWNVVHPALYFNISNSYFQLKQYGFALLYVEKALKLRPNNADYQANRKLILDRIATGNQKLKRKFRVVYGADEGFLVSLATRVSAVTLTPIFLAAYLLLFLMLVLPFFVVKLRRKLPVRIAVAVLGLLSLISGALLLGNLQVTQNRQNGIVVVSSTAVYPTSMAKVRSYELYEGTRVRIVDTTHPKRLKVKLSEDSEGWVNRTDLKPI